MGMRVVDATLIAKTDQEIRREFKSKKVQSRLELGCDQAASLILFFIK